LFTKVYYTNTNSTGTHLAANRNKGVAAMANSDILSWDYVYGVLVFLNIDSLGEVLSQQYYRDNSADTTFRLYTDDFINTVDSNYIISVRNSNNIDTIPVWMKVNQLGDTIWVKSFENNSGTSTIKTSVSEHADSTSILSWTNGLGFISFVKLNNTGDTLWTKSYQSSSTIELIKTLHDSDGNIYSVSSNETGTEILKLNANGDYVWAQELDSIFTIDVALKFDQLVFLNRKFGEYRVNVMKSDTSWTVLWNQMGAFQFTSQQAWTNPNWKVSNSISIDKDSSIVFLLGDYFGSYVYKLNASGNAQFLKMMYFQGANLITDKSNYYAIGNGPIYGIKANHIPQDHFAIMKMDSNFNAFSCVENFTSNFSMFPEPHVINSSSYIDSGFVLNLPVAIEILNQNIYISESGCVTFYSGLEENENKISVSIYPNSSSGLFHFENLSNSEYQVRIYASSGQEVHSGILPTGISKIDLSKNGQGVYYYKVFDRELNSETGKLILIR